MKFTTLALLDYMIILIKWRIFSQVPIEIGQKQLQAYHSFNKHIHSFAIQTTYFVQRSGGLHESVSWCFLAKYSNNSVGTTYYLRYVSIYY